MEGPWLENPSVYEQIGGFVRGYAGRRLIAACKTVCNPSLAPPPIAHTIGHANHPLHSYHCTKHPHGKKDQSTKPHSVADSFARPWGRTVIQTANRRRGQRPRPSHDHTQTLDAQAYTGSDLLTPSSAMQGRTLLIGTHSMCSAVWVTPPESHGLWLK